jgi:hypothetical protein
VIIVNGDPEHGIAGRPLAYSDGDIDYNGVINAADLASAKNASLNQGAALGMGASQALTPEPEAASAIISAPSIMEDQRTPSAAIATSTNLFSNLMIQPEQDDPALILATTDELLT